MSCFIYFQVLDLNVGGQLFSVHQATLMNEPGSKLASLVTGNHTFSTDQDGRIFIDADGHIFSYILEYLRFDTLPPLHLASQVHSYAVQFHLKEFELKLSTYLPVIQAKFLENTRSQYPNYEDIFGHIIKKISQLAIQEDGEIIHTIVRCVNANRTVKDICTKCLKDDIIIHAGVADRHASDIILLIQHDLKERGFAIEECVYCHCRNKIEYDLSDVENVFFHPDFLREQCFVSSTDSEWLRLYDSECSCFSYTLKIKVTWA